MTEIRGQLDIALKAHEANQALARFNGENASRAQAWGIAVWSALIAFSFDRQNELSLCTALIVLFAVFTIDLGYRRIQYRFISKSLGIERAINKYLLSGQLDLPLDAFSTIVSNPDERTAFQQFELRRWLFWLPYVLIFVANLALFGLI